MMVNVKEGDIGCGHQPQAKANPQKLVLLFFFGKGAKK